MAARGRGSIPERPGRRREGQASWLLMRDDTWLGTAYTVYSSGDDVRLELRREHDGSGRLGAPQLPQNRAKLGTEIRLRERHVEHGRELLRRASDATGPP